MSKYTPSPPYTEEEFADMVQCYVDSGKNIELTKMYYVTRYPGRRRPKPYTLDRVVQKYLKTLESNTTAEPPVDVSQSASVKDDRILKYFLNNSHATNKKAASIFNVPPTYIDKLLQDRKADMERMRNDRLSSIVRSEENSLSDRIRKKRKGKESSKDKKQDQSDSDDKSDTGNSEKPDETITICSENSNRETDDDVIYCKTEYTRKRKRKYKKRLVDKKLRTYERVQKSEDLPILETSRTQNPIVYTTRLEEMAILQKNINQFNNAYVINKILLESKPKYTVGSCNIKVTKSLIRCISLKEKLKKFERVETHIDLTHKIHTDDDEPVETEIINQAKCYTFNAKEEVLLDMSTKHDVAIVFNNLFSKTHDIYATDSKGNVIEYFCTKSNDYMKYVNHSKCRLTFDMCCWVKRQYRVESIWPRHEYPFSRFLTTTHKCPPGQCICCCKVEKRVHTPEVVLNKLFNTEVLTVCTPKRPICIYTASEEYNRNLLLSALRYNKPASNRCNNCSSKPKKCAGKRFLFSEFYDYTNIHMVRNEFFEIGSNHEIVRFHVDSHVRDRARCIPCAELTSMPGEPSCKLEVCCEWKRDNYLSEEYKASNISVNTFRFLKNTQLPQVCEACKVTQSTETNKSTNLDVIPRIEHSRTYVKPTLLKIGFMAEKQSFFKNQKYIRVKDIARQIPQCSNVIQEIKTNETNVETPAPTSTVKINVRCEQIPEYRFELCDVDIQVATAIGMKFKKIDLTVKEHGKVVASLNSTTLTTTTEEFQILADILQNIQNHLKLVPLLTGSAINLVVEIDNDKQSNAMNELFPYKLVDLIKNPPKEMTHNFNKRYNNEFDVNERISMNSLKDTDINQLPCPSSDLACNSNNLVNKEEVNTTQKLKEFDRFAIAISQSKNCYTESFKSFLKTKREAEKDEVCVPKISGVFSLQSLVPTNELVSANKTDSINDTLNNETPIASTSNNDDIRNINNLNAHLQSIGGATVQQTTEIIYDPTTNPQIVNFNSNAFGSSLGMPDANSSTKNENVDLMKPIVEPGQSNTIQALPYQPSQVKPHLPDIINDIPINNYVTNETNHTVVKDETIDEVVLLGSD